MKSVFDIAIYFLHRVDRKAGDIISPKKLQKLVYYAQVWSMVLRNQPLFSQATKAWMHGPVVRELWEKYQDYRFNAIPEPETPIPDFIPSELEVLEYTWGRYGELSARQLEEMTHQEAPWQIARKDLPPQQRSNEVVSLEDMRIHHAAESPWRGMAIQEQELFKILIYKLLDRPEELAISPEIQDLKNALLDAVEREHPNYTRTVTEALEDALNSSNAQSALTADEFNEWLTQL